MTRQPGANSRPQPGLRPLWQLLLAEQTGRLPPLTPAECEALLDFLEDLVNQGCDPNEIARRMAHCLARVQQYGLDKSQEAT